MCSRASVAHRSRTGRARGRHSTPSGTCRTSAARGIGGHRCRGRRCRGRGSKWWLPCPQCSPTHAGRYSRMGSRCGLAGPSWDVASRPDVWGVKVLPLEVRGDGREFADFRDGFAFPLPPLHPLYFAFPLPSFAIPLLCLPFTFLCHPFASSRNSANRGVRRISLLSFGPFYHSALGAESVRSVRSASATSRISLTGRADAEGWDASLRSVSAMKRVSPRATSVPRG